MEDYNFDFSDTTEARSATYKFMDEYRVFMRNCNNKINSVELQSLFYNNLKIRSALAQGRKVNIKMSIAYTVRLEPLSDTKLHYEDCEITYRRFFAYLATYCFRNRDLHIENPIAITMGMNRSELGTDTIKWRAYWGCTPGAHMNVTDFAYAPYVFEYRKVLQQAPDKQDFRYLAKMMSVKGLDGIPISKSFINEDTVGEMKSMCDYLDTCQKWSGSSSINAAKVLFAKLKDLMNNATEEASGGDI